MLERLADRDGGLDMAMLSGMVLIVPMLIMVLYAVSLPSPRFTFISCCGILQGHGEQEALTATAI